MLLAYAPPLIQTKKIARLDAIELLDQFWRLQINEKQFFNAVFYLQNVCTPRRDYMILTFSYSLNFFFERKNRFNQSIKKKLKLSGNPKKNVFEKSTYSNIIKGSRLHFLAVYPSHSFALQAIVFVVFVQWRAREQANDAEHERFTFAVK